MDLESMIAENRAWVEAGQYRRAIDRMLALIVESPHDLELRRELARVYRTLGHPDQAGRWGYIVPDGASDEERSRFIVGFRYNKARRIRELLLLDKDYPLVPDPKEFGLMPSRAADSLGVKIGSVVGSWILAAFGFGLIGGVIVFLGALFPLPLVANAAWGFLGLFLALFSVGLVLQAVASALQGHAKYSLLAGLAAAVGVGLTFAIVLSGNFVALSAP